MKKSMKWMITALVGTGLIAGTALAHRGGYGDRDGSRDGYNGSRMEDRWDRNDRRGRNMGMGMDEAALDMRRLFQQDMTTNRVTALAEISGKSESEVSALLQNRSMGMVMRELNVTPQQLQPVLHAKMVMSVYQAVEEKRITQEEADRMYSMMSLGPQGGRPAPRGQGYNQNWDNDDDDNDDNSYRPGPGRNRPVPPAATPDATN